MNPETTPTNVFRPGVLLTGSATAVVLLSSIVILGCQRDSMRSEKEHAAFATLADSSYAEDRALIEDLQARYMFALDFGDIDSYVATFTEDGILDIGAGEWRGRDTIRQVLAAMGGSDVTQDRKEDADIHPATGRHNITNIVIRIEGDTAYGRAYWFHMSNNNPERSATLNSYGHYEDEMVRVNGSWLFSKRKIYNEQVSEWAAPVSNPCW